MKLDEFIETLNKNEQVSFPGGRPTLKAQQEDHLRAPMLADTLKRLVPASADVHSGWQTSTLAYNWGGKHEWWLLLGDDLVRVDATGNSPGSVAVTARFLPLQLAVPKIVVSYHRGIDDRVRRERGIVVGMNVDLVIEGETLSLQAGREDLEAVTVFVGHLQAAIARARLTGRR